MVVYGSKWHRKADGTGFRHLDVARTRLTPDGALSVARRPTAWTRLVRRPEPAPESEPTELDVTLSWHSSKTRSIVGPDSARAGGGLHPLAAESHALGRVRADPSRARSRMVVRTRRSLCSRSSCAVHTHVCGVAVIPMS